MSNFYDWEKLDSYMATADVALLVGGRSIGKTFGARERGLKKFIKSGERMVELCRYAQEVNNVLDGYFDRICEVKKIDNWQFVRHGQNLHASMLEPVHGECIKNELIVYGAGLTQQQSLKKKTFANVGRVIFDEAILERQDPWHRYLNDEFRTLANMLNTILRETPDNPTKAKVFLMGNALDLVNPYFRALGINEPPKFGFTWYKNKSWILHYIESVDAEERKANTLVGRMLAGDEESQVMFNNEFVDAADDFLEQKSNNAKFRWALVFRGQSFGVWVDTTTGITYINRQIPAHSEAYTLALTLPDNRLDYDMILKADERLKMISRLYRNGYVRFDTPATRVCFYEVLKYLGMN